MSTLPRLVGGAFSCGPATKRPEQVSARGVRAKLLPQALGLWSGGVGVSGVGLPLGRTLEIKLSLGQRRPPSTWIKLYLRPIACDQRHSRSRPQIATPKDLDMGIFHDPTHVEGVL